MANVLRRGNQDTDTHREDVCGDSERREPSTGRGGASEDTDSTDTSASDF